MALRQATAERDGSRGATAGTGRAGCGPIVEVPRCFLSTLKAGFFVGADRGIYGGASHEILPRRIQ
jgi:hypothetical protein